MPAWRLIALDATLYVSSFERDREGHRSGIYRVDATTGGVLHQGFRRMLDEHYAAADRFL
jgi:hypothetical protein